MLLKSEENRVRVERLLKDDFKVEDLSRLLRMMRTQANKNSIIRDLGDLLAHEDIRDSGPLFLRGKEMYDSLKFNTECIHGNGLNLAKAPNNLWALISTNLRYFKRKDFFKYKCRRSDIEAEIEKMKNAATENSDGTLNLNIQYLHPFVRLLCFSLAIFPAYNDDDIYQELQKLLISQGLLEHKETPQFRKIKAKLALFTVAHLHRTELKFSENTKSYLLARQEKEEASNVLNVLCHFELDGFPSNTHHAQTLFESNLNPAEYVDEGIKWRSPIELDDSWILRNMRNPA